MLLVVRVLVGFPSASKYLVTSIHSRMCGIGRWPLETLNSADGAKSEIDGLATPSRDALAMKLGMDNANAHRGFFVFSAAAAAASMVQGGSRVAGLGCTRVVKLLVTSQLCLQIPKG